MGLPLLTAKTGGVGNFFCFLECYRALFLELVGLLLDSLVEYP